MSWLLGAVAGELSAQTPTAQLKTQQTQEFRYKDKDSVLVSQVFVEYDDQKRLLRQFIEKYDPMRPNSPLITADSFIYNPTNNSSRQWTRYPEKPERNNVTKTRYRQYAMKNDEHQPIWIGYFDDYQDLLKEDTFQYNAKGLVTQECNYTYVGSTSLFCDEYQYNRKGKVKRWRMYSKWTTTNFFKGLKREQAKRRDFKYKYNGVGQVQSVKGRYYTSYIRERYAYDAEGKLQRKEIRTKLEKRTKVEGKKKPSITYDIKTEVTEYRKGKPTVFLKVKNGVTEERVDYTYLNDTLISTQKQYLAKTLYKDWEWNYSPEGKLKTMIFTEHLSPTSKNITTMFYNESGLPEREEYLRNGTPASNTRFFYSPKRVLERIALYRNELIFTQTFYQYSYFE